MKDCIYYLSVSVHLRYPIFVTSVLLPQLIVLASDRWLTSLGFDLLEIAFFCFIFRPLIHVHFWRSFAFGLISLQLPVHSWFCLRTNPMSYLCFMQAFYSFVVPEHTILLSIAIFHPVLLNCHRTSLRILLSHSSERSSGVFSPDSLVLQSMKTPQQNLRHWPYSWQLLDCTARYFVHNLSD